MTTIILVRHGMNDQVKQKRLAGWTPGVHLNDIGRVQAESLATTLAEFKVKAVYSSPLERTVETAEPIAAAHDLPVLTREGLGEIRYGKWEGRTLKSLARAKLWAHVQRTPSLVRFPEGESFPEAQSRIVAVLEELRSVHSKSKDIIVCVSHADMIKLALAHYLGLPLDMFQRLLVAPASISTVILHGHTVRLANLNDTRASTISHDG